MGRCRQYYPADACESAQRAILAGPELLSRLNEVCNSTGPVWGQPAPGSAVGEAPSEEEKAFVYPRATRVSASRTGIDTDPWLKSPIKGWNWPNPVKMGPLEGLPQASSLDGPFRALRGAVGKDFAWEHEEGSRAMDEAADAVRVYDATSVGGNSQPIEGWMARPRGADRRVSELFPNMTSQEINASALPVRDNAAVPERVEVIANEGAQNPETFEEAPTEVQEPQQNAQEPQTAAPETAASETAAPETEQPQPQLFRQPVVVSQGEMPQSENLLQKLLMKFAEEIAEQSQAARDETTLSQNDQVRAALLSVSRL